MGGGARENRISSASSWSRPARPSAARSAVCIREAQRTLAQSSQAPDREQDRRTRCSASRFKLFSDKIETPGDGLIIFRGMQDHTSESIKSLEGFRIAWVDEAQSLSGRSLSLLRPTIRAEGSKTLGTSWNPRRKSDAIDDFFLRKQPGRRCRRERQLARQSLVSFRTGR